MDWIKIDFMNRIEWFCESNWNLFENVQERRIFWKLSFSNKM